MTTTERFTLALGHFERALARLHEALAQPENDFLRDSVIQRFEFTFEAAWKACYRWLRLRDVDLEEDAYSVFPEAFKRRLITDPAAWGNLRKYRNLTSHTYNEKMATEVSAFIRLTGAAAFDALANELRRRAYE